MEKKTYRVTFMADLTEDDVRAMKKCFYDAMNESMNIDQLWELQLEEIKDEPEPNPDTDRTANDYILNVGQTQDELTPFASAFTQEDAIELAKEAGQHWKCVEVVYMPVDNDDINEIVWSQYKK